MTSIISDSTMQVSTCAIIVIICFVLFTVAKESCWVSSLFFTKRIPMYIINLQSFRHRYDDTILALKGLSSRITFKRIEALDTRNMTADNLKHIFVEENMGHTLPDFSAIVRGSRHHHHELSSGSCGCFLSHTMRAWKAFIEDDSQAESDIAIFAEDDICLNHLQRDFYPCQPELTNWYLKRFQKYPDQWMQDCDLLLLSRGKQHNIPLSRSATKFPITRFFGLWSYMLSKRSARLLLNLLQNSTIDRQLDWKLAQFAQEGKITIHALNEPLFNTRGLLSTTQSCQEYIGQIELYNLVD